MQAMPIANCNQRDKGGESTATGLVFKIVPPYTISAFADNLEASPLGAAQRQCIMAV
jgi:hypothetical protein